MYFNCQNKWVKNEQKKIIEKSETTEIKIIN